MPTEPATMAAGTWAEPAQEDAISRCLEPDEAIPSLSGWRAGLAGLVVAAALFLLAAPALAAAMPGLAAGAAWWLERLAGLTPMMLGARAVVFVVALVVISRSDGRP